MRIPAANKPGYQLIRKFFVTVVQENVFAARHPPKEIGESSKLSMQIKDNGINFFPFSC